VSSCSGGSADWKTEIYSGTTTTGVLPLYTSTRIQRGKSNCILSHRDDGEIVTTTYRIGWGSSREPKICYLDPSRLYGSDIKADSNNTTENGTLALKVSSGWGHTATLTSTVDPSKVFKWKYTRSQTVDGKHRLLALFAESASSSSKAGNEEAVAVLVRTNSTRTPGTSRWGAGNGGQLVISAAGMEQLDEPLIIASCLMMLKKENERAKAAHGAAISSAAAS
jgi:hypothetical protein